MKLVLLITYYYYCEEFNLELKKAIIFFLFCKMQNKRIGHMYKDYIHADLY